MPRSKIIKSFTDRYPFIGPTIWILSVQYFIIQVLAAEAWTVHYSLAHNTISDLGNTVCTTYGGHFVCSPVHSLMNASFVTLGATMAIGSLLIYQEFKENYYSLVGFSLMAAAGFGSILVGLFPENTVSILHIIGAGLVFLVGNVSLVVLSIVLNIPRTLRYYTFLSGVISLAALVLFITHHYLGLGVGGMERVTAYPQTIWLITFGIYISKSHFSRRTNPNHK